MTVGVRSVAEAAREPRKKSAFSLVVAVVVLVGVFFIINSSFSGGVYDYASLAALNADWEDAVGREIQVTGNVVVGSVRGDADKLDITFDIEDGSGGTLTVHYGKILPDPFAEGREVIVQGVLESERRLEGQNLTVKCPSRYQDGDMATEEGAKYYEGKKAPAVGNTGGADGAGVAQPPR
jgi:cytochrome c-type biogenesis protein CcmE